MPKLGAVGSIVMMFTVSVVLSSTSQAAEFHTDSNPAIVTGEQVGQNVFTIKNGVTSKCATATFKGTRAESSTTLALEAAYVSCKLSGLAADINMNGCTYVYHLVKESSPPTALTDVSCPAGKKIEISGTVTNCVVKVGPQTSLQHAIFSSTGTETSLKDLDATLEIAGIAYEEVGSECVDPGAQTGGTYTGTITLKAFKDEAGVEGSQTALWAE
jgi:hypothetical protein